MIPKTLDEYGAPYQDANVVSNPETDISSGYMNRVLEDLAQITRSSPKIWIKFRTTAAAAPVFVDPGNVLHTSMWGDGAASKPTVEKLNTGVYDILIPTPQIDGLGISEAVTLVYSTISVSSSDLNDSISARILAIAGNRITLMIESPTGFAPPQWADVGDDSGTELLIYISAR